MRTYLLLAVAALSLASCRNNDQTDNTGNVDENLAAQNIVSNDVTAIDAVTGDAANMAADVDVAFTNEQQLVNGTSSTKPSRPSTPRPTGSQSNTVAPATPVQQPTSNTTTNSVQ